MRGNEPEQIKPSTTPTMKKIEQRKQALRHKILSQIKALNIEVTGDFWLSLIFRTESEMKQIAKQLGCP